MRLVDFFKNYGVNFTRLKKIDDNAIDKINIFKGDLNTFDDNMQYIYWYHFENLYNTLTIGDLLNDREINNLKNTVLSNFTDDTETEINIDKKKNNINAYHVESKFIDKAKKFFKNYSLEITLQDLFDNFDVYNGNL